MSGGFVVRLLVNTAALWVATRVVPGVSYSGGWIPFLGVALIFGVLNTFVGFTTKILTFPLIIVTLGVFIFVINGLMRVRPGMAIAPQAAAMDGSPALALPKLASNDTTR